MEALRLLEKSKPLKRIVYSLIALAVYYITPSLLTAIASIMAMSR